MVPSNNCKQTSAGHIAAGKLRWSLIALAVTGLLFPMAAQAQSIAPSQVTPREIAPPPAPPTVAPLATPDRRTADAIPGGDIAFTAGDVVIEGGFLEMAAANADFIKSTAQHHLTVSELFAAAGALEQAYARAGYILARVTIPAQRLGSDGPVRVVVTDGYIESIDAGHLPASIRTAALARLHPLLNRRHVTQDQIERRLLLAGNLGGLSLRSALAKGTAVGGARLVLDGAVQTASARVATDNALPASLGRWQVSGSLALNNLLGAGEQFYVTAGSEIDVSRYGQSDGPLSMLGGGVVLPLGSDGATLTAEYLHSRTHTAASPGLPAAKGDFSRAALRLAYPLILTRSESLNLNATVDRITQTLSLPDFALQLNRDRYTAVRLGLNWQRHDGPVPYSAAITFSQGISGRNETPVLPLSRQGASSTFSHLDGIFRTSLPIRDGFRLEMTLRGQTGFGSPQLLSEQFAIDAENGVSAFAAGSLNVDSGATLRGELQMPAAVLLKKLEIAPYLFAAGGAGSLEQPTVVEPGHLRAAALGFGARVALGNPPGRGPSASLGFEFGHGFSSDPFRGGGDRASITASVQF